MDNIETIIREIYNDVHPEIRKDFDRAVQYLQTKSSDRQPFKIHAFSQKPYSEDFFSHFVWKDKEKYGIYAGRTRDKNKFVNTFGELIYVYYIKNKGYSVRVGKGVTETVYFESDDWELVKERVDTYFKDGKDPEGMFNT